MLSYKMPVEALNDTEQFDKIVMTTDKEYIFVDAYTQWCGPCKRLAPQLEKLSEKYGEQIHFVKVDCDKAEEFAQRYIISSLPTLFYLKKGSLEFPSESKKIIGANLVEIEKLLIQLNGGGVVKVNDDF